LIKIAKKSCGFANLVIKSTPTATITSKKLKMKLPLIISILAVAIISTNSNGQNLVTWDLTGSGGSGSFGNVRTFTEDGYAVAATAWSYSKGSSNTAFENAALGQWSLGLGVANRDEGVSVGSPEHHVDNNGADDFVLFLFDTPVEFGSVVIHPSGTYDRDVSYWLGNVAGPVNLTNLTYSGLAGLGFGTRVDVNNSIGSTALAVPLGGGQFNAVLFGTQVGEPSSSGIDRFKIAAISATPVPEPGTALLLGGGLALGLLRRRRCA
jgi:hypothetical protein